ncbi:Probable mitochondrial-processing peptidase subunit beta, mitochondrial [Linum perenne]
MASKHILTLARRSHHRPRSSSAVLSAIRSSSSSALAESHPSPPPPNAMIYDRLAESVNSKIKQLENPDPRFLKYGSPRPTLRSHTHILSAPETRVTTLPNGLRVATESSLSAKTATVGVWIGQSGFGYFVRYIAKFQVRREPDCQGTRCHFERNGRGISVVSFMVDLLPFKRWMGWLFLSSICFSTC